MLLATFFFSLMFGGVKYVGARLPAAEITFFRSFIGIFLLLPIFIVKKSSIFGTKRGMLALRSVLGFTSAYLNFYAAAHLKLADASVLIKTSIIFTAVFSVFILKEALTGRLVFYSGLAFLGSLLIVKPSGEVLNLPGLGGLTAGALIALIGISIRRLHETERSETIVLNFFLYASVLSLLIFGNSFLMPTRSEFLALLLLSTSGVLGQLCFTASLKYCPASVVYPYSFFELLFALGFGALFWNEIPDWWSCLGAAAIVVSGLGILGYHLDEYVLGSRRGEVPGGIG